MYTLDGIFSITFLAVGCAVVAAFAAWVIALAVHFRKPRGTAAVVLTSLMAVVWSLAVLLTVAAVCLRAGVLTVEAGTLTAGGLSVPRLGRLVELADYPVSYALSALVFGLGIAAFVLHSLRRPRARVHAAAGQSPADGQPAAAAVEVAATVDAQPAEAATDTGCEPPADRRIVATETAPPAEAEADAGDVRTAENAAGIAAEETVAAENVADRSAADPDPVEIPPETVEIVPEPLKTAQEREPVRVYVHGDGQAAGLPLTRRHVILNRSNVVNMFSEYLSAKDGEQKEKLEKSINTIIIK